MLDAFLCYLLLAATILFAVVVSALHRIAAAIEKQAAQGQCIHLHIEHRMVHEEDFEDGDEWKRGAVEE